MIVIDATNIGVGGGTTHLIEILNSVENCKLNEKIMIFASNKTLKNLPDFDFVTKKTHPLLNKSLFQRFIFQAFFFKKYIPQNSILFSIAGDFFSSYSPMIGMSRNMLLFERRHWKKMNFVEQLRLHINYQKQKQCFKKAIGIIFVSNYSKRVINDAFDFIKNTPQIVINHGVSKRFYNEVKQQFPITKYSFSQPFVFNYISTVYTYKNHPQVIKAFAELRESKYPVFINFIGEIVGRTTKKQFTEALKKYDPQGNFSCYCGNIPFGEIHKYYQNCDGILYASSCENMPNIVIEAMLSGKPLVCSNLGSIPEFVKDNAFFFNPEDPDSIKKSVIEYLQSPEKRLLNAKKAQEDAMKYDWDDTARKTINFIKKINNELEPKESRKLVVLVLIRWYLPGYKSGGALRSIANLIDHLGDDIEFKVITTDRDFGDSESYPNVKVDEWNDIGKAKVFYASPSKLTFLRLAELINKTPHDVLYLNSFFDPLFTFKPLLLKKFRLIKAKSFIIAPRGEFSVHALKIKNWKKRPYILTTKVLKFYNGLTWQASNESEAEAIKHVIGKLASHIVVAKDLPPYGFLSDESIPIRSRQPNEKLNICFLSRIAPMKNLEFALEILSKIKFPVKFDIYGPIDDEAYWKKCERIIKKITSPLEVNYLGYVEHDSVYKVFGQYDLFFFPTFGENFGHVILESMLAGTPVLIANTTPWKNLANIGVGWDVDLNDQEAFLQKIHHLFTMETSEYYKMRQRVRNYALNVYNDSMAVSTHINLFNTLSKQ